MKAFQVMICAAAVCLFAAGVYADGRSVADGQLQVVETQEVGAIIDSGPGGSTGGGGGGCSVVYQNYVDGSFFFGRGRDEWTYDDIVLSAEGDLAQFRELVSYTLALHRRSSEPPNFTANTNLRIDLNGDATGGPVAGADGIYAGTECTIPDIPNTAGNIAAFPVCLVGGDSGINLEEGLWMGWEQAAPVAGAVPLNGGWLIAGGPATIGSSDDVMALSADDGESFVFSNFGGDPAADFNAAVCAQVVPAVPTVSEWGLIAIVLLVLTGGTIVLRKARPRTVSA